MSYGLKPKIEKLALTRETVAELTDGQAELAKGGRTAYCSTRPGCGEEIPQLQAHNVLTLGTDRGK